MCTVDTIDVMVLAVASYIRLHLVVLDLFPYHAVHSIAAVLNPRVCGIHTLHVFHAFTGCDITSFVLILQHTCTDFRGKILKEYTKVLKFGL